MELIEDNQQSATLKFTSREYALLSSILRVFEHKMENAKVDYQMLMHSQKSAEKFLADFWEIFER